MSRREITFSHKIQYIAARVAAFVFRILPLPFSVMVGRAVGALFCTLDRRHRLRVIGHLKLAFGDEYDDSQRLQIVRGMYRHFGTMLAEFSKLTGIKREEIDNYVDWQGNDVILEQLLREGKGVIFASGHIGNWELGGVMFSNRGYCKGSIARPLNNPLLDDFVVGVRKRFGQEIWDKFGALRAVLRELKKKHGCGMLVDQDAAKRGIMLPFFGEECSTMPTPADLALRTGSPVIICAFQRTGKPMKMKFNMRGPIRPNLEADRQSERIRILTEMNLHLESVIREHPEQWLWLHRRWKTRPEMMPKKPN